MKIGYLVPEFPGQTHNFFWRELAALKRLGVTCDLLSTRLPPRGLRSTSWEAEAVARTTYLYPPTAADVWPILSTLLRSGPAGLGRLLRLIATADVSGWRERLRFAGMALMGVKIAHIAARNGWTHLHVHSCANSANMALLAKAVGGISYSLTLHNPLWVYGSNQRMKWRNAAFGIVITEAIRQEVLTTLSGDLPPKIAVAPMGVEIDVFKRSSPYSPYRKTAPFESSAAPGSRGRRAMRG